MDRKGMIVQEILSPKEKERRAAQYQAWLEAHGYAPAPTHAQTLARAQDLCREISQTLQQVEELMLVADKLIKHTREIINTHE